MAEVERPVIPVIVEDSRMMTQVIPDENRETHRECEGYSPSGKHVLWIKDAVVGHTYTSLSSNPRQPQVQDHPPYVQHAADLRTDATLSKACWCLSIINGITVEAQ